MSAPDRQTRSESGHAPDPPTSTAPLKAGRREWTGVAVLALGALFINFDLTVLYLALPEMTADLRPSASQQLWIVDIYSFMVAGFLITMGSLGDRIGRRKLLLIGSFLFGAASLPAAFSTSPEMLIASRVVLGIGAATFAPSSLALLRSMFQDPAERGKAVGIWMGAFMGGSIIGPIFGGVILHFFWWGAVFLPAVVVMAAVVVLGRRLIPEYRDPAAGRLDPLSTALSIVGVLAVVWGVKKAAVDGWEGTYVIAILAGVALLAVFVIRQTRIPDPMVDMSLFRNRIFSGAFTLSFLGGGIMGGGMLIVNVYMQTVYGYSPLKAGLLLTPTAFALLVGIGASQGLARKFTPAYVIAGGLAASVVGFLMISQVDANGGTLYLLVSWALAFGGLGPATALGYEMILASTPAEKAGAASGTVEASGQLGTGLGIAALGSLSAWVYGRELDLPAGVDPGVAGRVNESVAEAFAMLAGRNDALAQQVLAEAQTAYTTSLNVVAMTAAVVFLAMSVLAAVVLRTYEQQAPEARVPNPDEFVSTTKE